MNEAKLRQLDAASSYRVYGHEVKLKEAVESQGATARRWRLINPCFCVQDSPSSPCPCMEDEMRWWLPEHAIIREGNAGRKDHAGQELRFFDVLVDSNIMVESVQPVSVGALKRLGPAASPEAVREQMSSGSTSPRVMFSDPHGGGRAADALLEALWQLVFGSVGDVMEQAKQKLKEEAEKQKPS